MTDRQKFHTVIWGNAFDLANIHNNKNEMVQTRVLKLPKQLIDQLGGEGLNPIFSFNCKS